eukprot:ANDGO_03034.mRNA.1 14 kDa zinc-binding protein
MSEVFSIKPEETLFQKILDKKIPAQVAYEDDRALAFFDINPKARTHILVISKTTKIGQLHERKIGDVQAEADLGHLLLVAGHIAKQEGVAEDGYRVVINQGKASGQMVNYLHIHLLGGREFSWPPG